MLGLSILGFSLLFYVRDTFNATVGIVSIFVAMIPLFYFIGCVLLKPLHKSLQPRHSIILATALESFCTIGILLTDSLVVAFAFSALFGLSASLFWPPLMGWYSAGVEKKTLNRLLSYFSFSWSAGVITGPYLGGLLFEIDKIVPILTAFGIFLAISVYVSMMSIIFSRLRSFGRGEHEDKGPEVHTMEDESTPLRFPSWLVLFVTYVVRGALVNVFPLYARSELSFSESSIGLLFLFCFLCMTCGFLVLGRMVFWHFRSGWIVSGLFANAIVILLLLQTESYIGFALLFSIIGLIISKTYTNSVFHGVSGSTQRTSRMAIHEALMSGGILIGSAVGGMIYQATSFTMALIACLVIIGFAVLSAGIMLLRQAKKYNRLYNTN